MSHGFSQHFILVVMQADSSGPVERVYGVPASLQEAAPALAAPTPGPGAGASRPTFSCQCPRAQDSERHPQTLFCSERRWKTEVECVSRVLSPRVAFGTLSREQFGLGVQTYQMASLTENPFGIGTHSQPFPTIIASDATSTWHSLSFNRWRS